MRLKTFLRASVAASLAALTALPALAQPYNRGPLPPPSRQRSYDDGYRDGYKAGYQAARLRARYDDRVPAPVYGGGYGGGYGDPDRWRARYGRAYTYNDDRYYQECRNTVDPAGVMAGALIGGLIGNAAGGRGNRGGTTVAGVIIGGALGAGLTQHLECEDRSYAYKTYYDALNSGRSRSDWQWDNPNSGNYGDFRVGDYYDDPDGFRCATYTQKIWVHGEPQMASGHACRQPDGSWTIVD